MCVCVCVRASSNSNSQRAIKRHRAEETGAKHIEKAWGLGMTMMCVGTRTQRAKETTEKRESTASRDKEGNKSLETGKISTRIRLTD